MLYGFVALVDPWDVLPLSPKLPRVPVSSNARYSFPALARSARFDSVILGDSTVRLLQPAVLDAGFHAHFANLAMNSATAYEQSRMFDVFLQAHPRPAVVIVGLTLAWCSESPARFTVRSFPEWMYSGNPWARYGEILTPYAVQEAANQFAVVVGWKARRYGLDGYTDFLPPDREYDPVRRDALFREWGPIANQPAQAGMAPEFPAMPMLERMLAALPPSTRTILLFPPIAAERLGTPGSIAALRWKGCKQEAGHLAGRHGATVVDYADDNDITTDRNSFWDPVHYRQGVAHRVMRGLIAGVAL